MPNSGVTEYSIASRGHEKGDEFKWPNLDACYLAILSTIML
jgi:hypothetical protein